MSKKLLPAALVLGILAAACAQAPAELELGSGTQFVPQVADPFNDAGLDPSVVVVDGQPYVAYFAFPEDVPEGSLPASRPLGMPPLPGVMLATVKDNVWTRGAIAIGKKLPNVQVKFDPAVEPSVGKLTPQSVTGLQLAADANGGLHAVWGSADGVFYASGSADPASTTPWTVEQVAISPGYGPSLAMDGAGNPWIAYTTAISVADLTVATMDAAGWSSQVVASNAGCSGCRTAMAVNPNGEAVVAWGDGANVYSAAPAGKGWAISTVERGGGGVGLAAATDAQGGLHLAYQSIDRVRVAASPRGFSWTSASIAEIGQAPPAGRTTGIGVDDQGVLTVAWYDGASDVTAAAQSSDGKSFTPLALGGTTGAESPAVAVTPDGSAAYIAWYASTSQDLVLGTYADVAGIAIAQPSPTPTEVVQPSAAPPAAECTPVQDGKVTVVAEGIAYTDGVCIDAPAGEPFTITFDNRDAGVQHNIQVFKGTAPSGDTLFQGDLVTGAATIDYEIPALDAGEYAFNCIVHPTMVGKIMVGGATGGQTGGGQTGGGGAGGGVAGGLTVIASGLAFDTDTITLTAGQESTITFDNQDSGVQHNISIYTANPAEDPNAEVLFQGDLVTGPTTIDYVVPPLDPGEYYFFCIVHPDMNGAVVVE
jgi:plastocyanin